MHRLHAAPKGTLRCADRRSKARWTKHCFMRPASRAFQEGSQACGWHAKGLQKVTYSPSDPASSTSSQGCLWAWWRRRKLSDPPRRASTSPTRSRPLRWLTGPSSTCTVIGSESRGKGRHLRGAFPRTIADHCPSWAQRPSGACSVAAAGSRLELQRQASAWTQDLLQGEGNCGAPHSTAPPGASAKTKPALWSARGRGS